MAASEPQVLGESLSDRDYFRQLIEGREWVVSDLFQTRDGEEAFVVARAIRDENGVLQGIAAAQVLPERLDSVLRPERIGQSAVDILDSSGRLVYRYPNVNITWDQRDQLAKEVPVQAALGGQETATSSFIGIDQQMRVAGLATISEIHWIAIASRPESEVTSPLLRDLVREASTIILVALVGVALAILQSRRITQPVHQLRQYANALAVGHLDAEAQVAGPREIEELARSFQQMAKELRDREKQRDMYIHSISHDLRAPLSMIHGHGQMLQRALQDTTSENTARHSAEVIVKSAKQMDSMIQELIDVARIESGQLRLNVRQLDLQSYMLDLKARLAAKSGERLRVEASSGLPAVRADPDRLERIVT